MKITNTTTHSVTSPNGQITTTANSTTIECEPKDVHELMLAWPQAMTALFGQTLKSQTASSAQRPGETKQTESGFNPLDPFAPWAIWAKMWGFPTVK
ncbi:MAG: hypothetical protein KGI37_05695 [Alphaproteobacteria bacterium]|nr:hypothetical protein [Alphaproteobacteria bacterium]